jgi:hypothetical protein
MPASGRCRWMLMVCVTTAGLVAGCSGPSSVQPASSSSGPVSASTASPASSSPSASPTPIVGPGQWVRIADVPRQGPFPLVGKIGVWTGSIFLSAGRGCCADSGPATIVGYSPATNAWRKVTTLPATPPFSSAAQGFPGYVWTGREIVFAGGTIRVPVDTPPVYTPRWTTAVMAYTPATGTWRQLASVPATPPSWWHLPRVDWPFGDPGLDVQMAWTGSEVLLFGEHALFRYDMATDTWRVAAPPPHSVFGPSVVWTGSRLIVWGGHSDQAPYPELRTGAAYDPVSDTWAPIPTSPVTPRTTTVWTGTVMLSWGGQVGGVAYNPGTRTWGALPWAPIAVTGVERAVWTGRELFAWSYSDRKAAAYNPVMNTWRLIPTGPAAPAFADTLAWAGTQVLLLGGWPPVTTQADLDKLGQVRAGTYAAAWVPRYPS